MGSQYPRWVFWKRKRGNSRKNFPGNMEMRPKLLLEADAPWGDAQEGGGIVAKVLFHTPTPPPPRGGGGGAAEQKNSKEFFGTCPFLFSPLWLGSILGGRQSTICPL